jgi:signal transduction histidine kinase
MDRVVARARTDPYRDRMTERGATRLAGGVWFAGLALSVVAAVLHVLTLDVPVDYYGARGFQGVFGLAIGGTGWLIASRRRTNPIGWLFVVCGSISCLQGFASSYGTFSHARHGGTLPLTDLFVWFGVWIWILIVGPMATFVMQLFPEARLETKRQRALAWFSGFAVVAFAVGIAPTPGQAGELPIGVNNPYAISKEASDRLAPLGVLFIIATILSIGTLVRRFRRSTGELRQQMKWLTYAGAIAAVSIVISTMILGFGTPPNASSPIIRISSLFVILGFLGIPIAAGVAILRYGLYEIDVVINKTIIYALLAVFITVVYVGVVVGIGALVGAGANTELSIAATAIVAVAIQPVRARAQHLANRLVFGKRATPYEALSEFSARLSEQTADVLPRLARLMTEATAADRAGVWLAVGGELRPVAGDPTQPVPVTGEEVVIPGWDRVYPVSQENELLGALAIATRANEPLSSAEERLLTDLASQAGLLFRNVRLIEELRASRQRLVTAQDQERRRIERNIHDGAQNQLVALKVHVNILGRMIGESNADANRIVEQLRSDLTDAIENLRALSHGIYPPMLAERGLVAALESQAMKSPLPVTVDGDGIGRYAQEVESAVYFCVLEALQNIAKYAQATHAVVRVRAEDETLAFEVADDGIGFDVERARHGAGLTNMADRLDALGGRLEVESAPGRGTTLRGWLGARA